MTNKKEPLKSDQSKLPNEKFLDMSAIENNAELKNKIDKLIKFFDEYGIDYSKFKHESSNFLNKLQDKKAYPNNDSAPSHIPASYDLKKWTMAIKNIHYLQKSGKSYQQSVREITNGWKENEVFDFLNWVRFYNEGTNLKYKKIASNLIPIDLTKTAQNWYESSNQPGYFLHIKQDPKPEEKDIQSIQDAHKEVEDNSERKHIIERQRKKIIGRLDSAEKLLRSDDGETFAGKELESLIESIHNLKKKIYLVNKISTSTRLYEDMIVRESNILNRKGFVKAANTLYSLSQSPAASGELAPNSNIEEGHENLTTQSPADPVGSGQSGVPSGIPAIIPGVPSNQTSSNSDQNKDQPPLEAFEEQPLGIKEFVKNMNNGNKTDEVLMVEDDEEPLTVEAQVAAPIQRNIPPAVLEEVPMTTDPAPDRKLPTFIPKEEPKEKKVFPNKDADIIVDEPTEELDDEPLEVNEDDIRRIDNKIDDAFNDITIKDVITKLTEIADIFKSREIPRQLAVVDIMMNKLGISSFFDNFSEIQSKVIESSNYVNSRMSDILSKLQSAINKTDLKNVNKEQIDSPELIAVRNQLERDAEKERARKEQRREKEIAPANNKEVPNIELGDLNNPIQPVAPTMRG